MILCKHTHTLARENYLKSLNFYLWKSYVCHFSHTLEYDFYRKGQIHESKVVLCVAWLVSVFKTWTNKQENNNKVLYCTQVLRSWLCCDILVEFSLEAVSVWVFIFMDKTFLMFGFDVYCNKWVIDVIAADRTFYQDSLAISSVLKVFETVLISFGIITSHLGKLFSPLL